jgi:DNA-binding protein H-NS
MAERGTEKISEWLEIDLGRLSGVERTGLIFEIMETLTAQELRAIRDEADKKRQGKLKDARVSFVTEMRQKAEQLDLTLEEVLEFEEGNKKRPRRKRESDGVVRIKYRSPQGDGWSGRGRVPVWLRELEEQGHNREEYLIKDA